MTTFKLPDLGEGLADAEIVSWHVKVGDEVVIDQPLVSVETAKAVVEVPSPRAGKIAALHGEPGERVETGASLVEFEDTSGGAASGDAGSLVGHMPAAADDFAATVVLESPPRGSPQQRMQAVPAARALARSLGIDLATVRGSGRDGLITLTDVMAAGIPAGAPTPPPQKAGKPSADGEEQALRGLRRAMAHTMGQARDSVASCSVFDDADLHRWQSGQDHTVRVLRAIAAGCQAQPGLNAWYDETSESRMLFGHIDVGVAVDTPDGLIMPVLRDIGSRSATELRAELQRLKREALERKLTPGELRNFTFMLSNFGMLTGRYATPVVVPPAVAILGTGRARDDAVVVDGQVAVHRRMPLSLSFDHRVVTGGEAVRFLETLIHDLELPE